MESLQSLAVSCDPRISMLVIESLASSFHLWIYPAKKPVETTQTCTVFIGTARLGQQDSHIHCHVHNFLHARNFLHASSCKPIIWHPVEAGHLGVIASEAKGWYLADICGLLI